MFSSFVVPIALLSIFPHQEPRFIIPVLLPLCYICTPILTEWSSTYSVISTAKVNGASTQPHPRITKTNALERLWFISNILLAVFYGFLHQGGVLPLTSYLSTELRSKPELTHVHLFTSYTYPLPSALLQLRNTKKVYFSSAKHKYQLVQDFYLREFGSRDLEEVYLEIVKNVDRLEKDFRAKHVPFRMYYALPASSYEEFRDIVKRRNETLVKPQVVAKFYPHFSMEKLPVLECFGGFWNCLGSDGLRFFEQFGLLLVRVESLGKGVREKFESNKFLMF